MSYHQPIILLVFILCTINQINADTNQQATVVATPVISGSNLYGQMLTISGSNFAADATVNGIRCLYSPSYNPSTLYMCSIQEPWTSSSITYTLTVGGQVSNAYTLTGVNPYSFPMTVSQTLLPYASPPITITGSFLGNSSNPPTIMIKSSTNFTYTVPCGSIKTLIDQTKIECTPAIVSKDDTNMTLSIQLPGVNQFTNSEALINYRRFSVSNVQQDNATMTVFGDFFDIYTNTMEIAIGSGKTNDIKCTRTMCIFTVTPTMTYGQFTMKDNTTGSTASTVLAPQWKPVIKYPWITEQNPDASGQDHLIVHTQLIEGATSANVNVGSILIGINGYNAPTFFNYIYPAPLIKVVSTSSTIDNAASVTINGKYLYQASPTPILPSIAGIVGPSYPTISPSVMNYTFLVANLPKYARSGNMTVTVAGQVTSYPVFLKPNVTHITTPPTSGGIVTITGYYLALESFSGVKVLDIQINGQPCNNSSYLNSSFDPYYITCQAPPGSGLTNPTSFNGNVLIPMPYQPPTIDTVSSTILGQSGTVTISGSNFANTSITVTIGPYACGGPVVNQDYTQITCNFGKPVSPVSRAGPNNQRQLLGIPSSNNDSLPVTVVINGQSVTQSKFLYSSNPSTCINPCDHGTCVNGECLCDVDYTGINCSLKLDNINSVDVPKPSMTSTSIVLGSQSRNVSFDILIAGIREISSTDVILKYVDMRNTVWNLINTTEINGNLHNVYNTSLDGISTFEITVEMTVFKDNQQYNFEGDLFQVSKNSVKYKITLSKWPFTAKTNYLQVLFQSSASPQSTCDGSGEVNPKLGSTTNNTKNSLRQLEIQQGTGLLRAYYSDRLLVDGRLSYSQVTKVDDTDPSMSGLDTNNSTKLFVITALNIPPFTDSAVIDPNYASLLVVNEDVPVCGTASKSSQRVWLIPVIVVASIVGVALIVITAVLVAKRNRLRLMLAGVKLREMSNKRKNKV
ncbi:hypothetical protein SAMD00019534_082350 [Acytostelium subglobosum LB1]|uniref:hypothetical protein n=1 Tax=Acytostelium subglobosum LB1 TaxID=1410327 RepID=UPI0006450E2E|nr:hypothetical protein SAMD00019534_082350 [Acytostelium subglobosum LB1]GAM25060.1 hypothetical protein SAMD00019534_082350 [Acytostelium subglobosum LB1]|eukprot:XP_012752149.1 hypothetical protein SAMD00019534_082350 [Acytostelium subglobosum LB1]